MEEGTSLVHAPGFAAPAFLGAVMILVSVGARYWLPTYGATVPRWISVLDAVFSMGIATGLIGSGLLAWMIEGEDVRGRRHSDPLLSKEQGAKPNTA
jgi:hypothetical protein